MLLGNCEGARARVCVYSLSWWGLNVLAFFYLNRLTCFSIQSLLQSHTHTHTCTHTKWVRKEATILPSPPPSSEDVRFFFSLSPRLPGRGTLPFVSKGTLYLSLSDSLSSSFTKHKEREGEVFHLDQKGHRDDLATKGADHETEKGDVSVYLYCRVLCSFPLACGLGENDRRMSGLRARLFSLKPYHGKHIHALWDLFIP